MIIISKIASAVPCKSDYYELEYKNAKQHGYRCVTQLESSFDKRFRKKRDISSLYGLKAADELLRDSKGDELDPEHTGIIISNTYGGWNYVEDQLTAMYHGDFDSINPYVATAWFATAAQGEISIRHHIMGYSKTICAGSFGGALAIKHAYDKIQEGTLQSAITGGVEATNTKLIHNILKRETVDGAVLMLLEKEDSTAYKTGDYIARIISIEVGNTCTESLSALAREKGALYYSDGMKESKNSLSINDDFKEVELFSIEVPDIIAKVCAKLAGTNSTVQIDIKRLTDVFSILLEVK